MRTIILDTNILIDNVHGFALWLDRLLALSQDYSLAVPTIVVAEYLAAREAEKDLDRKKSKKYLALFRIQDLNFEIAEILGQILRRKTYLSGASTGDLIIASTAIFLDAPLATRNKLHFKGIPGLRFFDPKEIEE